MARGLKGRKAITKQCSRCGFRLGDGRNYFEIEWGKYLCAECYGRSTVKAEVPLVGRLVRVKGQEWEQGRLI
jgi:uncharacterized protein (UPF0212 family)